MVNKVQDKVKQLHIVDFGNNFIYPNFEKVVNYHNIFLNLDNLEDFKSFNILVVLDYID